LSVYGSYSKGFMPQNSQSPDIGGPFDPEYSSQIEFGLKKDFLEGQWTATAAWYSIDRENVLVPANPSNPYGRRQATGKANSTGIELDLTGEILPNWNIKAGYAYNESQITNSTYDFVLKRQANNAPYHNANLWTRYTFTSGLLSGFGISAGMWHVGKRYTDGTLDFPSATLIMLPEYTVVDAGVQYRFSNVVLNLYGDNLFNQRYIYGASNAFYMQPGKPRNFMLRIQFTI
jgi:iron complex outermembrane recepter protein